jgi:ubiquinone/menaquinone biosynthesis C-methylase UbiE
LKGAAVKLKERGLYVNADGTRLPFRSNTFDAILCAHTLYHMPKDEQANAVREFARVLKPGRKCVIFYNVGEHSLAGRLLRPFVFAKRLRNRHASGRNRMYSHHYPAQWFRQFVREFSKIDTHVYRLFPNQLMKYALPDNGLCNALGDILIPRLVQMESKASATSFAQYVVVVLTK